MNTPTRSLGEEERIAWLRLARTPGIGPSTFHRLLSEMGSIQEALEAAPRLARRGGRELEITGADAARQELDSVRMLSGQIIASIEPAFPSALAALDPPPPVITVIGRAELLSKEIVAIVGARNASALGIKFAQRMAAELSYSGLVVASGMARGIDRAAHESAMEAGTIAVVAGGADIIYPPENGALYKDLVARGAIVSEMPLGTAPQARHFPRRNRIISGLSRGVVVVEAAERSGSLITAEYALEQGREVFAVPGSPLDPRSRGSNRLLKDGATLATTSEDVLNALQPILNRSFASGTRTYSVSAPEPESSAQPSPPGAKIREMVEEKLSAAPVEIDELVRQVGAPAPAVLTILLELELARRVQRHPGARISWC
jgi:DNA processing protein